jgi:alanine racemase
MANADEADDSYSTRQRDRFDAVRRQLPWIPYAHAANSATALRRPDLRYSGVRIGLAMHGLLPDHTPDPGLRPTLSLKARLARVLDLAPGEGVAYGLTWRAGRPSRVALVPVGYADGWRRSLGNKGEVLLGGHRCPMVGRVMMDQFLVDVTEAGAVAEGDEAVLIGTQGPETITADDVARELGTISWEVLASLQARLPRIYHRGGAVVTP